MKYLQLLHAPMSNTLKEYKAGFVGKNNCFLHNLKEITHGMYFTFSSTQKLLMLLAHMSIRFASIIGGST